MDNFYTLPIKKIIVETPEVKTFCFAHNLQSKAGQFVMLWIPGVGQKPFSVGYDNGEEFGLTIFKRGKVTAALFDLQVGDRVGIAGPYGTKFTCKPNMHYVMVAGGYGVAPLRFLADQLVSIPNTTIDFCFGARSMNHLILENMLRKLPNLRLHIATNDGSNGHHGNITDLLPSFLTNNSATKKMVAICGPELMEKKALDICNQYQTACEISMERYIKCGTGVCGQCAVDGVGICLCKEGPVVSRSIANRITEFGHYARNKCGQKHFIIL
jgi:dihydroorotate dehydrogenase electron transfer subunit